MSEELYEKGDRVWVRSGTGARLPGVVIGRHVPWDLYRVAYVVDVSGRGPRAVETWRLSRRRGDEPATAERAGS